LHFYSSLYCSSCQDYKKSHGQTPRSLKKLAEVKLDGCQLNSVCADSGNHIPSEIALLRNWINFANQPDEGERLLQPLNPLIVAWQAQVYKPFGVVLSFFHS
jgi:hypothetical protein